ncbi:MAG: glucose PTS transporter subunit IIA [Lachnospiraceae bacterium]|nr:glucose PTS transporter subunit IIA [Lachnospiraceae bacterium]
MALDYHKCAEEIVRYAGGRENLISAAHCATRLRLVVADNSKINVKAVENVDGVKGTFSSNGQFQVIIGTGTVNKVYDEFLKITGMSAATKDDVKAAAAAKAPLWRRLLKVVGDVFVPILPAIVASGLMMGLVEALGHAIPGFSDTDWYNWLDMVANTAFAYLPVIVAVSAARVFGGNIFLGAVIGLLMIHSNLVNAWSVASYEGTIPTWHLLFFTVKRVGYQGHVIPVIIAVWLMSTVEKWLHKHVPEIIDLFVTPLCTVLVTAFLTFTIIGPIFSTAETYVLNFAQWLITVGFGIGAAAMGAIYPITVVMGLHHMYNVIEAGMLAEGGKNIWMPIASAANFAQFGACLAVGVKTHNAKRKAVAVPSSLSASLGITEPAIFGVNLRLFKPFVCGMIGGAVGAWFGSVSGIGASAYGVTGIPGYLTIDKPLQYTLLLLIAGGTAFVLTMISWKEAAEDADAPAAAAESAGQTASAPAESSQTVKEVVEDVPASLSKVIIKSSAGEICQPVDGTVIPYTKIPDPTFASGALGQGVGIEPKGEIIYAPCDGEISSVAESKHAIGITGANDQELLIHVGVDTVEMNGDGFEPLVKEGDHVHCGQPLLRYSLEKIKAAGHPDTVVVLLTNSDDYENVQYGEDLNR